MLEMLRCSFIRSLHTSNNRTADDEPIRLVIKITCYPAALKEIAPRCGFLP